MLDTLSNPNLEEEIKSLEEKLAEKRRQFTDDTHAETKDLIKESLLEKAQEVQSNLFVSQKIPNNKEVISTTINISSGRISFNQLKKLNKDKQIDILARLAISNSIAEAIEWAQKLDNPYVIDKLHDTLVDKFYEELTKRGKI